MLGNIRKDSFFTLALFFLVYRRICHWKIPDNSYALDIRYTLYANHFLQFLHAAFFELNFSAREGRMATKCRSWKEAGFNKCLLLKPRHTPDFLKGLTIGHQTLQFLLLLKITRMLEKNGCRICMYIYSSIRKIDREKEGLIFAFF